MRFPKWPSILPLAAAMFLGIPGCSSSLHATAPTGQFAAGAPVTPVSFAQLVERVNRIASIRQLSDGSAEWSVSDAAEREGWEVATAAHRGRTAVVKPGQSVYIENGGAVGEGAHWFEYVGPVGEYLLFRERSWFYDLSPELDLDRLVQLLPY